MANLTGYGGVGEIGGNAFLLQEGKSRIFLDFGKRFGNNKGVEAFGMRPGWNDYWDDYLKPRTFRLVPDLLALDLIPAIEGLYRADLGGTGGTPPIDGVIVSHPHQDHFGLIGLLKPHIPILTSPQSRATLYSVEATGNGGAEMDLTGTKARGNLGRTANGKISSSPAFPDGPPRAFDPSDRSDFGALSVQHVPVDHSICGARASLVTGPSFSLAYTGDFRLHGRSAQWSERLVERAQGVDFLLTEGTRVHRPQDAKNGRTETDKETDVESQILEFVSHEEGPDRSGFVGIAYPPRDLDRFISVYQVAKRTKRRLVISTKQAHLLETLRSAGRDDLPDPRHDTHLAIHIRAKKKGTILEPKGGPVTVAQPDLSVEQVAVTMEDYDRLLASDYDAWERPYLSAPNAVTSLDVGREPTAYLFSISYWSVSDLMDIFGERPKQRGLWIHSMTQPFNDEMESDALKLARWTTLFRLDRKETHVSGHVGEKDLAWVIDKINPRVLVPVHSQGAELTAERFEARTGRKALMLQHGATAELV